MTIRLETVEWELGLTIRGMFEVSLFVEMVMHLIMLILKVELSNQCTGKVKPSSGCALDIFFRLPVRMTENDDETADMRTGVPPFRPIRRIRGGRTDVSSDKGNTSKCTR